MKPTRYRISFPRRQAHFLDVEVVTPDLLAGEHEFFIPVWTPGSYLVREYERHVESVVATDAAGAPLAVRKSVKNRWRVALGETGEIVLRYRVYARDLTVRTNYVDAQRAYWNGAATYVCAVDRRDAPATVEVDRPGDWRVHTGLPEQDGVYHAATLDEAVDAPFVVSPAPVTEFTVAGARHRCVFDGVQAADRESLTGDISKIVTAAAGIFGGQLPYASYVFLVFADSTASGGLEHANSSVIHITRRSLRKADARLRILGLFAHEHFHVWNVKRIRPPAIARFDFERENYTRDLWLAEGFTSYYQEVVPYRAGLFTREFFLDRLATNWANVVAVPGRREHSVSDASFDAWIKLYRPDETTRNSTVSYYSKGAVVALGLDLLIGQASQGRRSLDDVMRALFAHYESHGPGQSRDLVLACCNEAAGTDLSEAFEQLVDGTEDPPLAAWFEPFGIELVMPDGPEQATLDAETEDDGGRIVVKSVARSGAGERIGLSPGDEIVAIDGERVSGTDLAAVLRDEYDPHQDVEIHVFRRGMLASLRGALGGAASGKARLVEHSGRLGFRL